MATPLISSPEGGAPRSLAPRSLAPASRAGEPFNPDGAKGSLANQAMGAAGEIAAPVVGDAAVGALGDHVRSGARAVRELKVLTACTTVGILFLIIALIYVADGNSSGKPAGPAPFWLTLAASFVFAGGTLAVVLRNKQAKYSEPRKRPT